MTTERLTLEEFKKRYGKKKIITVDRNFRREVKVAHRIEHAENPGLARTTTERGKATLEKTATHEKTVTTASNGVTIIEDWRLI
jgi:hypothetical protein